MALESFYEDLVIDTPEKVAAIERMCANPEKYTYHCTGKLNFRWATREEMDRFMAKFMEQRDDSGDKNDDTEHDVSVRADSDLRRAARRQDGSELRVCARGGEPRGFGLSPRECYLNGEERPVQDLHQPHEGSGDSGLRHARNQVHDDPGRQPPEQKRTETDEHRVRHPCRPGVPARAAVPLRIIRPRPGQRVHGVRRGDAWRSQEDRWVQSGPSGLQGRPRRILRGLGIQPRREEQEQGSEPDDQVHQAIGENGASAPFQKPRDGRPNGRLAP